MHILQANSAGPDQTQHSVASFLVLHCLPLPYKIDAGIKWKQYMIFISLSEDRNVEARMKYIYICFTSQNEKNPIFLKTI